MATIGLFSETGRSTFSRGRWWSPQLGDSSACPGPKSPFAVTSQAPNGLCRQASEAPDAGWRGIFRPSAKLW